MGDIVDRGPKIRETIDYFQTQSNARCLMGNHERKSIGIIEGNMVSSLSQTITKEDLGNETYISMCEWLKTLKYFELLDRALCVHGFFEPGIPLHEQQEIVLAGVRSGEHSINAKYEKPANKKWYELYDGTVPLIVGHLDYRRDGEPFIWNERVYCIDTDCVRGGRLTGLLLPEFRIIQVAARRDYWSERKQLYLATHPSTDHPTKNVQEAQVHSLMQGKDLLDMGLEPGPIYGKIMKELVRAQKAGLITTKTEAAIFVRDNCLDAE